MKMTSRLRWLLAGGILLATTVLLLLLFFITKSVLDLWDQLQDLPSWLFYFYMLLVGGIGLASGWVIVKVIRGGNKNAHDELNNNKPPSEESLSEEIAQVEESGMDTSELHNELQELRARREAGHVHIAFFGDISTGKSSIIKALLPEAGVEINLEGGSTREINEYSWKTVAGDSLQLTDLPGRNEAKGSLDEMSHDEAIRAHIVVYVVDSDLSRTQYNDILELLTFNKPIIIVINKSDQYTAIERRQIAERVIARFAESQDNKPPEVTFTQAGGMEEVIRIFPDGREETFQRPRKAKISELAEYLQMEIDQRLDDLSNQRDESVYNLVKAKLDSSVVSFRQQQADKIIRSSTKKAIVGALASISPGTDIVIQGVLGTRMVQELCKLHNVPIRQLDIDQFLTISQSKMKSSMPLILAVAGNGLKAFPGIGTVAGGLVHAVAYGIIFDALGNAVARTLEQRGELKAAPAASTFQEMLSGNLEERTKTFAKLVVDQYRQQKEPR